MTTKTNQISTTALDTPTPQQLRARLDVSQGTSSSACLRNNEEYAAEYLQYLAATLPLY